MSLKKCILCILAVFLCAGAANALLHRQQEKKQADIIKLIYNNQALVSKANGDAITDTFKIQHQRHMIINNSARSMRISKKTATISAAFMMVK